METGRLLARDFKQQYFLACNTSNEMDILSELDNLLDDFSDLELAIVSKSMLSLKTLSEKNEKCMFTYHNTTMKIKKTTVFQLFLYSVLTWFK